MATQVQWRGGSTAEHSTFTGAAREVTVDTQKKTLVVHDGSTPGGEALLREDQANLPSSVTNGIYTPGTNQVAVATNGTGRLFIDASGKIGVGIASTGSYFRTAGLTGASIIEAYGADSDGNADIEIKSNGTSGASRLYFSDTAAQSGLIRYTHSTDSLELYTAGSERLRITSAGLVGVGTSTPGSFQAGANNLVVGTGSGDNGISIFAGASNEGRLYFARTGELVRGQVKYDFSADKMYFAVDSATKATLTSTGLGIGTTSPSSLLHLNPIVGDGIQLGTTGKITRETEGLRITGSSTINNISFVTSGSETARIDTSGRLLVGTSSSSVAATAVFQGNSSDANGVASIRLSSGTASPGTNDAFAYLNFGDNSHAGYAWIGGFRDGGTWSASSKPSRLVFSTTADGASSPTERMRINNAGRILTADAVGKTFATSSNQFTGSPDGTASVNTGNVTLESIATSTSTRHHISLVNTNGVVGSISTNASATAYNTSSDYRLKENVTAVTDGIARLQQLKPSRFNFIADPDKTVDGFIAHEVQTVVPEAITGEKDAVDDDGNPVYQGIDQSKLVPLLTAALQEAVAKIESLEARLTAAGI